MIVLDPKLADMGLNKFDFKEVDARTAVTCSKT